MLWSKEPSSQVHLIHWNEDLYESYDEAKRKEDGIAILAVFAKVNNSFVKLSLNHQLFFEEKFLRT